MKNILLLIAGIFTFSCVYSQSIGKFWKASNPVETARKGQPVIIPEKYISISLFENNLQKVLFDINNSGSKGNSSAVIELPTPEGTFKKFLITPTILMEEGLSSKFPQIKAFNAEGIDDPYASGKLDWTEFGFHAIIRTASGDVFIDPYSRDNTGNYIVYYSKDFKKDPQHILPENEVLGTALQPASQKSSSAVYCVGDQLRTFRLAVACTGEYAKAATGKTSPTKAQTLSAVVTTVNRVNSVYEKELAVKLILVANDTNILYTNPSTDPFTGNNNSYTLINESQTVIDNVIGNANYDIGHTFSTGGGGLAFLGCVCTTGSKASGITGSSYPVGDPFDIDYVAHEMGHQFGGNHTFNSVTDGCSGNRNASTAAEPGSGVTIMGYAGLCDTDDLASNSIPYFHAISFDEIMKFLTTQAGCAIISSIGNTAPVVTASPIYNIPKSTAFTLTGSATDVDGDALTYQWEEVDIATSSGTWNSGKKPYFRSYAPVTLPTRMFPKSSVVLSGNYTGTKGEYVPSTAQTLNFRLTARDNKPGGGGVCSANTQVNIASSGPFSVTYPNTTGITWLSNSTQTITWDVNGTDAAPVNCISVNILLSTDGGNNFTTLLANTPNDGSEDIVVPIQTNNKTTCRIKVESFGNVFFDINDKNFTISSTLVGVQDLVSNEMKVKIFPNPFENNLEISLQGLNKTENTNLEIYDLLGKVVLSDMILGKKDIEKKYDLHNLRKGVYFIRVSNNGGNIVSKLVKQ